MKRKFYLAFRFEGFVYDRMICCFGAYSQGSIMLGVPCGGHKSHDQLIFTFFLGADEDIESPDMTTSRLIPRISLTSAAPKVETMTLKTQSITPAQTEVRCLAL